MLCVLKAVSYGLQFLYGMVEIYNRIDSLVA